MPQKSYTLGNLLQDCLDCDIRKSDIRQFFDDLKKKAHFVYAILCGAPKSVFWITLDDEESHPDEKTFSVAEFNDNYENFDSRIDSFRVNFNAYFFREQWATKFPEWKIGYISIIFRNLQKTILILLPIRHQSHLTR